MGKKIFSVVFSAFVALAFFYGASRLSKDDATIYPGKTKFEGTISGIHDTLIGNKPKYYALVDIKNENGVEVTIKHTESFVRRDAIEIGQKVDFWYDPSTVENITIMKEKGAVNIQVIVLYVLGSMMVIMFLWLMKIAISAKKDSPEFKEY